MTTQRVVTDSIFAIDENVMRSKMLRNVFIREETRLPSFCYADGKRSAAPPQRRIDTRLDSGIRAIAIELDLSYEEARRFVELEISAEKPKTTVCLDSG